MSAYVLGSTQRVNQCQCSLRGMLGGSLWLCEKILVTIGPSLQEILIDLVFQPTLSWK